VPESYTGPSAAPVMFNFHGFGGGSSQHMIYADMGHLAEANGFILVYPQGALLKGSSPWNAGLKSSKNKSAVDDFGFIESLINELFRRF
tara:strand:+ start:1527 stop:1793 length:267 start_codon:yes stop_codon:yes gene_type:complete